MSSKELASRNDPTGEEGDTHQGFVIKTKYGNGVFAWAPIPVEELIEDIVEDEIAENDQAADHYAIVRNILNF